MRTRRILDNEPKGARVAVILDNGTVWITTTRNEPWFGSGRLLVSLVGKAGGYSAERVTVFDEPLVPDVPDHVREAVADLPNEDDCTGCVLEVRRPTFQEACAMSTVFAWVRKVAK
jgi:hypothetical protein